LVRAVIVILAVSGLALTLMLGEDGASAEDGPRSSSSNTIIEPELSRLYDLYIEADSPSDFGEVLSGLSSDDGISGGLLASARFDGEKVLIEAAAEDAEAVLGLLKGLGLTNGVYFNRAISGYLPISAVPDLTSVDGLTLIRIVRIDMRVGSVTSQGDAALRSNLARSTHGVDGTGVTIGVISDSYNCDGLASVDVASGDLPSDVVVLEELTPCSSGIDEGRAMMQLIHDVAPGANLIFQTGFLGPAAMAQGILDLETAGADIIVDDIGYLTQPFFQDGVIAQAVDTVTAAGVVYFSAAGNDADQSYESVFRAGASYSIGEFPSASGAPTFFGGIAHDFDPGPGVVDFQRVTFPIGSTSFTLQWDQPAFSVSGGSGSLNDVDFYIFDDDMTTVLAGSNAISFGGDPIEFTDVGNSGAPLTVRIAIMSFTGPNPGRVKYIHFGSLSIDEFSTDSSTIYGHPNAATAGSVAAADYLETPAFGTSPPVTESFSSLGGTRILFDTAGNPVNIDRQKPDFTASDGTDTTFFGFDSDGSGFPNFLGTSAAAPHAAGVAALLLDVAPSLSPATVIARMENTAVEMGPAGYDTLSGHGLIDALALLETAEDPVVTATAGVILVEGDNATLEIASFKDPDVTETYSATVNWGDGTATEAATVDQNAQTVSGTHTYSDDGVFTATVTVSDDDSGVGSDTADITVTNALPVVDAGPDQTVEYGAVFNGLFTFSDLGPADTHTATIDWGDGSTSTPVVVVNQDADTASSTHIFIGVGTFTVTVSVTDDDGGTGSDSMEMTVTGVPLVPGDFVTDVNLLPADGNIKVTWTPPLNLTTNVGGIPNVQVTGYHVACFSITSSAGSSFPGATVTSFTMGSLTNGVVYTCEVSPTTVVGNGPAQTETNPISAVPRIQGVWLSASDAQILVAWTAPDGPTITASGTQNQLVPVIGYRAECRSGGTTFSAFLSGVAESTTAVNTVPVRGLTNGTSYSCSVTVVADISDGPTQSITTPTSVTPVAGSPLFAANWGSRGDLDGEFIGPIGVDVDSAGNVYVADQNNHRIQKFASDGTFITEWGSQGSGDGQFARPAAIAISDTDDVYMVDGDNYRIQKFTTDGNFIEKWGTQGSADGEFNTPRSIAVSATGDVYVLETNNTRIQKFSSDGTFITRWGSSGSSNGQFQNARGIAVDPAGNVYVADGSNNRIQGFDSDGTFITKWGVAGSGDGQLDNPQGIDFDSVGDVYVAEPGNHRVQKFTSEGVFLTKWGDRGPGYGQIENPQDIAVAPEGKIYVSDGLDRVQAFGRLPDPPTDVVATPGAMAVLLSWAPPEFSGIAPITHYTITATPGGSTTSTATTSATITGLTAGTSYVFTVTATNSEGISASSTPSAPVTSGAVSLAGVVRLQGITSPDIGAIGATAILTPSSGGSSTIAALSSDGSFSFFGVSPGTYEVQAAAPGYISALRQGVVIAGSLVTLPEVELRAGLVDADSVVSIRDISAVAVLFGQEVDNRVDDLGRIVDINADGVVNALDISAVASNFGMIGPQAWPE